MPLGIKAKRQRGTIQSAISRLIVRKTERTNRYRSKAAPRRKVKYLRVFRQAVTLRQWGLCRAVNIPWLFFRFGLMHVNATECHRSFANPDGFKRNTGEPLFVDFF